MPRNLAIVHDSHALSATERSGSAMPLSTNNMDIITITIACCLTEHGKRLVVGKETEGKRIQSKGENSPMRQEERGARADRVHHKQLLLGPNRAVRPLSKLLLLPPPLHQCLP